MTIGNSHTAGKANNIYNLRFGDLYFYDSFFIVEMKEGVVITKKEAAHILDLVHINFGYKSPYGLISNRLNSYSSDLIDISPLVSDLEFLVASAVVLYNSALIAGLDLENRMLKLNGEVFTNINDAIEWTKKKVEKAKSLNQ